MAGSERFSRTTPECRSSRIDAAGHCLRASFSCPDANCPEINGLLMRLFSAPDIVLPEQDARLAVPD